MCIMRFVSKKSILIIFCKSQFYAILCILREIILKFINNVIRVYVIQAYVHYIHILRITIIKKIILHCKYYVIFRYRVFYHEILANIILHFIIFYTIL